MARCPYLEYESNSFFGSSSDKYICKLSGRRFETNDDHVKYTCNADYGDHYKECQIYKDRRW